MSARNYPNAKTAAHYLMDSAPYMSGLRWVRRESGWVEVSGDAMVSTGRTAVVSRNSAGRWTYTIFD